MIVFDLRCAQGHVFEAWFGSSTDYEAQKARSLVVCPICGDSGVEKAVMAPNVSAKGNSRAEAALPMAMPSGDAPPSPEQVKQVLGMLAKAQAKALEKSEWVGSGFADKARAMHLGEADHKPIHGQVSAGEAKALADEGVPVAPLPFPVVPPEAQN